MASSPLLAVLMLGRLGFAPWQYGLAFAAPCVGGLFGSRIARRLVTRFGRHRVMLIAGTLRAGWLIGLVLIGPGTAGLLLVMAVELGLITCVGVFNPVFATYRLQQTATDRVARTLSAWSVTSSATIAGLTALWGLLAHLTSIRTAIALAGLLLLATPLLLPRREPPGLGESDLRGGAPARVGGSARSAPPVRRRAVRAAADRGERPRETPRIKPAPRARHLSLGPGDLVDVGGGHRVGDERDARTVGLGREGLN